MPNQQLTEEQKKFVEQTMAHRKEKVEELAYQALAISLKADIPVFDLPYYILARAKQIIEETFTSVSFDNPKLKEARKKFLKECLTEMKAKIKFPEKKEEKDATDKRDNRCEPIAQALVNMLLDPKLIFSDENYFERVLIDEENIPLKSSILGYANALDEKMMMIVSEHWRRALKKLMGKEKEDVTFTELDSFLKLK